MKASEPEPVSIQILGSGFLFLSIVHKTAFYPHISHVQIYMIHSVMYKTCHFHSRTKAGNMRNKKRPVVMIKEVIARSTLSW